MLQIIQGIENPLSNWDGYGGLTDDPGPVTLISNIFLLVAVVAGVFALGNLVISGIQYISSNGDPKQTQAAMSRITMSFIGLVIIAASYTIAALIGQLLFGDAGFIFNPEVYGPGSSEPVNAPGP